MKNMGPRLMVIVALVLCSLALAIGCSGTSDVALCRDNLDCPALDAAADVVDSSDAGVITDSGTSTDADSGTGDSNATTDSGLESGSNVDGSLDGSLVVADSGVNPCDGGVLNSVTKLCMTRACDGTGGSAGEWHIGANCSNIGVPECYALGQVVCDGPNANRCDAVGVKKNETPCGDLSKCASKLCDGLDNNCSGVPDELQACTPCPISCLSGFVCSSSPVGTVNPPPPACVPAPTVVVPPGACGPKGTCPGAQICQTQLGICL